MCLLVTYTVQHVQFTSVTRHIHMLHQIAHLLWRFQFYYLKYIRLLDEGPCSPALPRYLNSKVGLLDCDSFFFLSTLFLHFYECPKYWKVNPTSSSTVTLLKYVRPLQSWSRPWSWDRERVYLAQICVKSVLGHILVATSLSRRCLHNLLQSVFELLASSFDGYTHQCQ